MTENYQNKRSKYWQFIIYEKNLPKNWRKIMNVKYQQYWSLSALHKNDSNEYGIHVIPHWHVYVYYDSPVTFCKIEDTKKSIIGKYLYPLLRKIKGV